jgi:hypothetical protein
MAITRTAMDLTSSLRIATSMLQALHGIVAVIRRNMQVAGLGGILARMRRAMKRRMKQMRPRKRSWFR